MEIASSKYNVSEDKKQKKTQKTELTMDTQP